MRGWFVGTVGALVIVLSLLGLSENAGRAGPYEARLDPVLVPATAAGTFQTVAANDMVLGVCLEPPCQATASLDLRIAGLPSGSYRAHLELPLRREELGPLLQDGSTHGIRWQATGDYSGTRQIGITLAGHAVGAIRMNPSATGTVRLDGPLTVSWDAEATGEARLSEIGGVTVSTVATVTVHQVPPAGWTFHARLEGQTGTTELGALDPVEGSSVLEARVERMALEDQRRLVVVAIPDGAGPRTTEFPVVGVQF